jgi:FkbM family methyltransferase
MSRSPAGIPHRLRKLLHSGALRYVEHAPTQRGKHRLMALLDRVVGPAQYDVGDLKLLLSPHRLIDNYIIRQGSYAPELVTFIRDVMSAGGGFIDVGANIGYLSLVAARAGGSRARVYAFEPSVREYSMLLEHIALNQLMNVIPYPFGIGASDQAATLWLSGLQNPGQNSRFGRAGAVAELGITLAPIDALLPAQAIKDVRCVKIDVEGDECSVLAGFSRVMPLLTEATFLIEISPDLLVRAGHSADQIYQFFHDHGFRTCRAARPQADQWDELFVAKDAPDPAAIWY